MQCIRVQRVRVGQIFARMPQVFYFSLRHVIVADTFVPFFIFHTVTKKRTNLGP